MFGIVDHASTQYSTGLYYKEYPSIETLDEGERFKYREQAKSSSMKDVVAMLSNLSTQKTIVTNYRTDFRVEGYVLLGDTLYRIMDIAYNITTPQTARIIKRPREERTLILNRVSNALELEI